jgi:hypothetical protein
MKTPVLFNVILLRLTYAITQNQLPCRLRVKNQGNGLQEWLSMKNDCKGTAASRSWPGLFHCEERQCFFFIENRNDNGKTRQALL